MPKLQPSPATEALRELEGAQGSARAPIGRGPHARERVLRAALYVLADHGLAGFSMEAVARRAGASKATVYRHWASQSELLVDAMDMGFQPFSPPTTGSLRADLIELLSHVEVLFSHGPFPRLMAAFIDAAESDPALASLHERLTERRREPAKRILTEARQRGEISPTTDLELVIDLLAGASFYRRFVAHWPFPGDYSAAIVDLVLAAIRSHFGNEQLVQELSKHHDLADPTNRRVDP